MDKNPSSSFQMCVEVKLFSCQLILVSSKVEEVDEYGYIMFMYSGICIYDFMETLKYSSGNFKIIQNC